MWFGWRANFIVLAVLASAVLAATWRMLDETNPRLDSEATRPARLAITFSSFLVSPVYVGHMLSVAFVFSGLMAYTAASPFLFIERLGLTPDRYGMLALFTVAGYLAGTLAAGRLTMRLGIARMVLAGNLIALAGGLAMMAPIAFGHLSVAAVILPMMVFLAGMGMVLPNSMAGAMAPFPEAAGAASALLGLMQMAAAATASILVGHLSHDTQGPLAVVVTGLAALSLVSFLALVWRRRRP